MKRIRLVTAAFGEDQKELKVRAPIAYKDYIVDQVFYNNSNTKSRENSLHPRTKGKLPKMMEWLEHPGYDYYIWVDSKFTLLDGFLENMMEFENDPDVDLCLFNHPERSSIKDELNFMLKNMSKGDSYLLSRYVGEKMKEQVDLYLSDENYIDDKLLYCGLFMYTSRLVANSNYNIMTDWLLNNVMYSVQDQLSFPYLLTKHKINYKIYSSNMNNNSFMMYNV